MQSSTKSLPGAAWLAAGLLYLGGLAYALGLAQPVPPETALLLLAAVPLELTGGAAALYLGLALSQGPAWSVLALTLGGVTRVFLRRSSLAEVAAQGLAVLAACLPLAVVPGWPLWARALLAIDLYLPLALRFLGRPFPLELTLAALSLCGPVGLLAAGLAPLLARPPAPAPPPPAPAPPRRDLKREDELVSELERSRHDYRLLEEASVQLGTSPSLESCLDTLAQRMQSLVECQSAAVFLAREGGLTPVAYRSPYREQLANAALTSLKEDLVEEAHARQALALRSQPTGSLLFPSEGTAAALPLGKLGVAYAGRAPNYPFTAHELRLLALLANQAEVAAANLRLRDEQKRALELYQESCARLESWAGGLSGLVEGARAVGSSLETEPILDALVAQTRALSGCSSLALFLDGKLVRAEPAGEPFGERMGGQLETDRPLLLDGRWKMLREGESALLLVPVGTAGVLCLGGQAFSRQQQDLVSMLACHAAVALDNARHHRELEESQMQLVQSSKLAAVGQLAAGVAHELNTPLASILLSVELAADLLEKNAEGCKKRLDQALKSALRSKEIVAKLLYYARDAQTELCATDLHQVVRDTLELHGHQLRLDGLDLACELGPVPEVAVRPGEIQQVLVNLLLNARDAVSPQGGRVWVRTRHCSPWVELEVEDSGPGVAPEAEGKIFDPFFTTKDVGQGTGLGLSVSRQIVERHGGTLTLESGSRFLLRLPERA